ncbi:MAG: hypothetical protein IJD71_07175 [Clostridia bacterium]|nr:hypothetical protein [Clostridia bacterium]
MKKAKKYVYPFVFSIGFYVFYIILGTIINTLDFEGYGGLGLFMLIIILWILVATPIFCFKYSKLIYEEKWKFLFIIYNSLVISLCHTGPFLISAIPGNDADIIIKITLAIFGWVALCTYVSFLIRLNTTDGQDDNGSNEIQE